MKVPGYSYESFCQGIAAREGTECFIHNMLAARRAAVIEKWRIEGYGDVDRCAGWTPGGLLNCDGGLDGHHLLSKSWLKSEFGRREFPLNIPVLETLPPADWPNLANVPTRPLTIRFESLAAILNDPRNGVLACRRHHDLIEGPTEAVKIKRDELPACAEEFAAELGDRAVARLERNFGVTTFSTDLGRSSN